MCTRTTGNKRYVNLKQHETFKEDQPSILKGQEDELIITPVQFTEMKRECGEAPEKRFCTINEYQKLGNLLTDVTVFI